MTYIFATNGLGKISGLRQQVFMTAKSSGPFPADEIS